MATAEHYVTYRNGSQVMVKGLALISLGYKRGARVSVTSLDDPEAVEWIFVVDNDEHSTLKCRATPPPPWLSAGVRVRIAVESVASTMTGEFSETEGGRVIGHAPRPPVSPKGVSSPPVGAVRPRRRADELLFDAYVIVDWSANDGPKTGKDSIWWCIAEWTSDGLERGGARNPPTRQMAFVELFELLQQLAERGKRVLLGLDFAFGYPSGLAESLELPGTPWLAIWTEWVRLVSDLGRGRNNRFEVAELLNRRISGGPGPFWGHPPGRHYACLAGEKGFGFPISGLQEFRLTDLRARKAHSVWKVFYSGSVGGQALCGIPFVHALRHAPGLAPHTLVWPFETGFGSPPLATHPQVIIAEVFPSLVSTGDDSGRVRDEVQVLSLAAHLAQQDADGRLGDLFATPAGLSVEEARSALTEEGWILGT